jgi:branched-chain amino acid aminotransferase
MSRIETLAWFNGELMPVQDIRVSALSHTLHYGTGIFEGIRCYRQESGGGGVFRLGCHLNRLHQSARILGIEVPWTVEQLTEATRAAIKANKLDECYVRPLVWLDEGSMGVGGGNNKVQTMVAVWKWGAYLGSDVNQGIKTMISGFERAGPAAAIRAKVTGQYVVGFMAKRTARALGFDEALLLDRDGYLAEGSGENLFLVRNGKLLTAPDESPILHGITRDTVTVLAQEMGLTVEFRRFGRSYIYSADEAFFTGTAAEITPIRVVDDRHMPSSPGPVTKRLRETYLALVRGKHERSAKWVTAV